LDSFFFNITDTSYKVTKNRVDISNGIVFIHTKEKFSLTLKNLDRMLILTLPIKGSLTLHDNLTNQSYTSIKSDIYLSSRQDIMIDFKGEVFILFIADFFLKRYRTNNPNEPIDFLYNKLQKEITLQKIGSQPLDALTLHIVGKIIHTTPNMQSIRCEHQVIELMIHRFSLMDIVDKSLLPEEIEIAKKAKKILLKDSINPPSIQTLAHLCATNESKLKKVFKKVYNTTIYGYIQKLRLEKANYLLKDTLLNIGEIAKEVGYKHQGHFSKLFFEYYGVYPKDLLKR
jgi:AraC-like DNA-binding protein